MTIILFLLVSLLLPGCSAPRDGIYHTVKQGETLYRISRTYGVDERYLARLNGVDDPTRIETGQLIYIPSAVQVLTVPPKTASPAPLSSRAPSAAAASLSRPSNEPKPATGVNPVKAVPKAPPPSKTIVSTSPSPPPSPQGNTKPHLRASPSVSLPVPATKADRGKFDWPVRGRILKGFGTSGSQSCQGIEISVPTGTPILSASDGTVTYSGSGIRGYGNLIILKHDDAYFTVYAFNQKNLVKAGAKVAKGDKIALSGNHPGEGQASLHFEIRRGKTAVNPIFYLP